VLDSLDIYMVDTMDEVLKIALAGPLPSSIPSSAEAEAPTISDISDDTITH